MVLSIGIELVFEFAKSIISLFTFCFVVYNNFLHRENVYGKSNCEAAEK